MINEIQEYSDVVRLETEFLHSGVCAIDCETNDDFDKGFRWSTGARAFMATFAASFENKWACYDPDLVNQIMQEIEANKIVQIYHNAKFDLHHLREWAGYIPRSLSFPFADTMFGFRFRFPGSSAQLKVASIRYTPRPIFDAQVENERAVHKWLNDNAHRKLDGGLWYDVSPLETGFAGVPKDILLPYAVGDAELTLYSYYGLLKANAMDLDPYKIEIDLVPVLLFMEKHGWSVSKDLLLEKQARGKIELQQAIKQFELMFPGYKPSSSTDLIELIFESEEEEVRFTTKGGKPATHETAIKQLTANPLLRDLVLRIRHSKKFLDTVSELLRYISSDGAIHSDFKSESARTGRFGSANPNLQNKPVFVPDEWWTHIRDTFIPAEDYEWILADYSQIEVRLFAHYSQDATLIAAIERDDDLHVLTASRMFGLDASDVDKTKRGFGKGMNFTIMYGAGIKKMAGMLRYGISGFPALTEEEVYRALNHEGTYEDLARQLKVNYYQGIPTAKKFIDSVVETLKKRQPSPWIRNAFGMIVPVPMGKEYVGVNYLIQGSAAYLMKKAMVRSYHEAILPFCWTHHLEPWKDVAIFTTIHDEIGYKVPKGKAKEFIKYLNPALNTWPQFRCSIKAKFAVVDSNHSWATKQELLA